MHCVNSKNDSITMTAPYIHTVLRTLILLLLLLGLLTIKNFLVKSTKINDLLVVNLN